MFKTKYIMIAAFAGLILTGCKKDYLNINTNPNSATESLVTPDLSITAAMATTAGRNAGSWDFIARWMGYWSASGSYSRSTVEMSYNITNDFGAGIFEGVYYNVGQYRAIEKKSKELGWAYYEGMAKVLGAYEMINLVDLYNNVPYSKAFDLAGNIRPTYDKGEDVYKALFAQLDAGLALIKAADVNKNTNIQKRDIMFAADKVKWAKFVNTVKLKMLIHTTNTSTFSPAAEIAKINTEGSGYLGSGLSAEVQPGYVADKPNPFYSSKMFNAINGNENDNYNRANNFTLSLMNTLADPRVSYVYRSPKAGGALKGTIYGSDPLIANSSDNTSGVGYGIGKSFSMPMWVMTSVEAAFYVAEATARGWISGNAQTAYNLAVRESFSWLGIPNAATAADAYLRKTNAEIAWPTTGTLANQLSVIAWQKYLALNGIGILETWNDVRRLKVVSPALSIAPERGTNQIPSRLLYPTSEYNYNAENVKAEGTISQFTSKVFWHK
jgi:hypothetical protein